MDVDVFNPPGLTAQQTIELGQLAEKAGIPDDMISTLLQELTLTGDLGSLDRQIEKLEHFRNAGLTEIALGLHEAPADGIRRIGEYVIPALQ
jgi:hypothetical protein